MAMLAKAKQEQDGDQSGEEQAHSDDEDGGQEGEDDYDDDDFEDYDDDFESDADAANSGQEDQDEDEDEDEEDDEERDVYPAASAARLSTRGSDGSRSSANDFNATIPSDELQEVCLHCTQPFLVRKGQPHARVCLSGACSHPEGERAVCPLCSRTWQGQREPCGSTVRPLCMLQGACLSVCLSYVIVMGIGLRVRLWCVR